LHLLFVGGDFARKGGGILLEAFRRLAPSADATLHLVTASVDVEIPADRPDIRVYRDLAPNSERLRELFRQADIFVFPTPADCLPLAILEAMAAGLPIITTSVGALPEAVISGETGLIVPPDDPDALADAITRLAEDPDLRLKLGCQARQAAVQHFDATTNYGLLLDLIAGIAR
jgi:glycosyltransferase involved in cell wall biosynthesis